MRLNPEPAAGSVPVRTIALERQVLAKNDVLAAKNRIWLREKGILAINLMSSPGAGKTTLLENTLRELGSTIPIGVIEGDQETLLDSNRLRAAGCRAVQINTGAGCHLDAGAVGEALTSLDPPDGSVVFVENVGNLVCPALFDLGEHRRVVIASITEGEDKPLKYPHMFQAAHLVLLNKIDLLPYLDYDVAGFSGNARIANPSVDVVPVSATRDTGLEGWHEWLRANLTQVLTA
ncbi:hydrogenase nickel incorporation protein HypB [Saccharopolyspora phatthalungensis]|uniref:Hydrogenase nickel incorporation protein HypB n=1 Tax=Saccharopolyspora phatthalungensis TaxID=664693 RepID=A0A840PQJ5_9PSEU|nr:hydrogenase nickel incorporation protein HypB [Saccharopolyspora phatthalungensis]